MVELLSIQLLLVSVGVLVYAHSKWKEAQAKHTEALKALQDARAVVDSFKQTVMHVTQENTQKIETLQQRITMMQSVVSTRPR